MGKIIDLGRWKRLPPSAPPRPRWVRWGMGASDLIIRAGFVGLTVGMALGVAAFIPYQSVGLEITPIIRADSQIVTVAAIALIVAALAVVREPHRPPARASIPARWRDLVAARRTR